MVVRVFPSGILTFMRKSLALLFDLLGAIAITYSKYGADTQTLFGCKECPPFPCESSEPNHDADILRSPSIIHIILSVIL